TPVRNPGTRSRARSLQRWRFRSPGTWPAGGSPQLLPVALGAARHVHADPLVQLHRAGQVLAVHHQAHTLATARAELAERVEQERRAETPPAPRPPNAEHTDVAGRRLRLLRAE